MCCIFALSRNKSDFNFRAVQDSHLYGPDYCHSMDLSHAHYLTVDGHFVFVSCIFPLADGMEKLVLHHLGRTRKIQLY